MSYQISFEIMMKNTARRTLLVTVATAALMAGAGLVSAQDTKENRETPAASKHDEKAPAGKMEQHPGNLPQTSSAPTAQAPMKEKPAVNAEAPAAAKPQTTDRKLPGKLWSRRTLTRLRLWPKTKRNRARPLHCRPSNIRKFATRCGVERPSA